MSAISDFIFANSNQDYFGSSSPFGDPRDVFIDSVVNQPSSEISATAQVNNNLVGTQGNDYLAAYNFTVNELDTLTGGAGADTFVAGNASGIHYTGAAISFVTDYNSAQGDVGGNRRFVSPGAVNR
jgi:Ca2+-binding RTX toxin-like protein